MPETFGDIILEILETNNLTYREMQEATGIPFPTLSSHVRATRLGVRRIPRITLCEIIVQKYGLDRDRVLKAASGRRVG